MRRTRRDITIPDDARTQAVRSIRRYFTEELDQDIGDLKAGLVLDYFLREIGPSIYNQAIADARAYFEARSTDLESVCYHAEFPYWDIKRGSP